MNIKPENTPLPEEKNKENIKKLSWIDFLQRKMQKIY